MVRRRIWSLVPLSTLVVMAALVSLFLLACGFAFNNYIAALNSNARTLLSEALSQLAGVRSGADAVKAGQRVATRLFPTTLVIVFIGPLHRVTVVHAADANAERPATVVVRARDDRSAEPEATGLFARLVYGFASICGLQIQRAEYRDLDIYVKSNDRALVNGIRSYEAAFGFALVLVVLVSALSARVLTLAALRPLIDVTVALERFASGDFTPNFVASSSQAELGALARAYNGAVAQVQRAFDERERANAMMRQFIADAGHQLRTPLTVIRGFVTLLADFDAVPPSDRQRMLQTTMQQIALMRSLIDNLILLERWEEADDAEPQALIDVAQLVDDIVAMTRDAYPLRTVTFTRCGAVLVRADPSELGFAVTNAIDNALNYTLGAIHIAIARTGNRRTTITIRDEGPGMEPHVLEHAFDRFFRGGMREVNGSGLGLTIARKAIERAGGSVSLTSSVAQGTTVLFELPCELEPSETLTAD